MSKQTIHTVLLVTIIVAILIIILMKSSHTVKDYEGTLKAKDDLIQVYQKQVEDLKAENKTLNDGITQHQKNDSLLLIKSNQVTIRYEKISSNIMSLSKDSLRSAVWGFGNN